MQTYSIVKLVLAKQCRLKDHGRHIFCATQEESIKPGKRDSLD